MLFFQKIFSAAHFSPFSTWTYKTWPTPWAWFPTLKSRVCETWRESSFQPVQQIKRGSALLPILLSISFAALLFTKLNSFDFPEAIRGVTDGTTFYLPLYILSFLHSLSIIQLYCLHKDW